MIEVIQGDITQADAEAIVNAANEQLVLGSGVAGAIRQGGGPSIQDECDRLAPIKTGEAVLTGAGDLPQRYVIHAVAPCGQIEGWEALVASCMDAILRVCEEHGIGSVAVPALGTGVFNLPSQRVAELLIGRAKTYSGGSVKRIVFVLFDRENLRWFEQALSAD